MIYTLNNLLNDIGMLRDRLGGDALVDVEWTSAEDIREELTSRECDRARLANATDEALVRMFCRAYDLGEEDARYSAFSDVMHEIETQED